MAYEFKFDKEMAQEEDYIGTSYIETSGVYPCKIAEIKLTKSKSSESEYVATTFETEEGIFNYNFLLTGKQGQDTYVNKKGEKKKFSGHYELNKLLAVTGKASLFKGDFSILKGAKLIVAVEFKESMTSEFPDKDIKAFFRAKDKKTAYEISKNKDAIAIETWTKKLEKVEEEEAKKEISDEDSFPF